MPDENLDLEVVARHPEPVADISMELRTNIKVKRSGVEAAVLLLMGVLVALLALDPFEVFKKR